MTSPTAVIDAHSNHEELIERVSKHVGTSERRQAVFSAIYGRHKKPRTFKEIRDTIGLDIPDQSIRNCLSHLANHKVISRSRDKGQTYYGKVDHVAANRKEILKYAISPKKLNKIATKRRPKIEANVGSEKVFVPKRLGV